MISHGGWGVTEKVVDRECRPASLEGFTRTLDLYLTGTYNVLRLAAARMAKNLADDDGERGSVVATASIAGYEGQIGQSAYAAAKAGVIGLTLSGARDLSSVGIRLNTIAPGTMHTSMMESVGEEALAKFASNVPFPKRLGKPRGVRRSRLPPARQRLPQRRGRPARRGAAVQPALTARIRPSCATEATRTPSAVCMRPCASPSGRRHRRRALVVEQPVVDPAVAVEPDGVVERRDQVALVTWRDPVRHQRHREQGQVADAGEHAGVHQRVVGQRRRRAHPRPGPERSRRRVPGTRRMSTEPHSR